MDDKVKLPLALEAAYDYDCVLNTLYASAIRSQLEIDGLLHRLFVLTGVEYVQETLLREIFDMLGVSDLASAKAAINELKQHQTNDSVRRLKQEVFVKDATIARLKSKLGEVE